MTTNILAHRAMLARLSVSMYTARALDRSESRKVASANGAQHGSARVHKTLVDPKLLLPIQQAAALARTIHYRYTLPWQDDAWRILPSPAYLTHDREIAPALDAVESGADALCKAWERDDIPSQAQHMLGALWRADDYPSALVLRSRFAASVKYRPMPSEQDWRVELSESDKERFRKDAADAHSATSRELWTRLHDAVAHMADVLSRDKARIYTSMIEAVREAAALMPMLNVTGDPALDATAQEILARLVPTQDSEREADTLRASSDSAIAARAHAAAEIARKMRGAMGA